MNWKWWYWIVVFIPLILGMLQGSLNPINRKYQKSILKVRPPAWVFGVVWSLLYLLFGFAWVFALDDPEVDGNIKGTDVQIWVVYILTFLVINTWPWLFNKNPKNALYIIVISILLVLVCMILSPMTSRLMLAPLLTWLFYATMMNYTIVLRNY